MKNEKLEAGLTSDLTSDEPKKEAFTLRGFGVDFDCKTGRSRNWYCTNGIKKWVDNDQPCSA